MILHWAYVMIVNALKYLYISYLLIDFVKRIRPKMA